MSEETKREPTRQRDGWVTLGMIVSATSAALTSFDGLRQLALAAGWTSLMAPLLPLTIDAFAATATRIWLADGTKSKRARRFARTCTVGAILLSLGGNAVFHLIAANLLAVDWVIVLTVGAIPPVVLGLITHLAVLRGQVELAIRDDRSTGVSTAPSPVPGTVLPAVREPFESVVVQEKVSPPARPVRRPARKPSVPRYGSKDVLMNAARHAAETFQAQHGKQITRDGLRAELRIGGQKATELLRRLKNEATKPEAEA